MFEVLSKEEFGKYIKNDVAVVIIVANDNELEAGKSFLKPLSSNDTRYEIILDAFTYYCGVIGEFCTCLVKTNNQGSSREGASRDTVEKVIDYFGTNIVIISAGIAFGLKDANQKVGDILVSDTFREFEIGKIGEDFFHHRSVPLEVDRSLFNRFSQDKTIVVDGKKYNIFKGEILTSEKVINNYEAREKLIDSFPDAIGGEMEGSGIYRASKKYHVPIILIKSISDWGDGTKDKTFQEQASVISFMYIKNVLGKKDIFSSFNIDPFIQKEEALAAQDISIGAEDILRVRLGDYNTDLLFENGGKIIRDDYKYYFNEREGFLFLKNHIDSISTTLYQFSRLNESKDKQLSVFVVKENKALIDTDIIDKKAQIEKARDKYNLQIVSIEYIDEFILKVSQGKEMMRSLDVEENVSSDYIYIDQKIENIPLSKIQSSTGNTNGVGNAQKGIPHFLEKLRKNNSPLISIITGEGGIGKTRFLDELQNQVHNQENNKRVIFLTSDDIIRSSERIEIKSITNLYEIIMENNGWQYNDIKLLELNFSCGNIILFIDGLEEVHAALGEDFLLDGFFESINKVSKKWQNVKIIITTREEYLQEISKVQCVDEIQFYKLNGFEKEDLEEYLIEVYDGKEKEKHDFYSFLSDMDLYDENKRVSPLFVEWIVQILEDKSKPIVNDYLVSNSSRSVFKKDKLFQLLMQRELDKKNIEVSKENIENLFSVLNDMIIEYKGHFITLDEFEEICESHFEYVRTKDISEMTIFNKIDKKIKVRHELLNVFIPSRYLLRAMIKNELDSEYIDYVCSLYWNGKDEQGYLTEMASSIDSFFPDKGKINEYLGNTIVSLKEKIKVKYYDNEKKIKNARKAISGCIYLAFNVNNVDNKPERTSLLKDIFNKDLSYMSIYGAFYPLSFQNMKIENGLFYKYDNFNNSSFIQDSIIFHKCIFIHTDIKNNKEIKKSHFDESCEFFDSNIEKIAMNSEKLSRLRSNNAESFLAEIAKYIRKGQRSENLIKLNVKPRPKDLTRTLRMLMKNKFLKKLVDKNENYALVKPEDADRLKMKDFGGYENLLEKLMEEM